MARHQSGRGAPRGPPPPRGFHAGPRHATHNPYAAPSPALPPHGGPPSGGFGMAPPRPHLAPPLPYSPPAPPSPATAALERDVASFVHSLRTSRSDMTAPPNALNVRDAIQAICAQFGTAAYETLCAAYRPQLPVALRALQSQHERVWSFVTCYRHARRLHTLFECHAAFLQHEGIRHFAELGIGNSFLHTDAVQSLYHAPSVLYRLTTMDVLTAFRQFEQLVGHDAFAPSIQNQSHRPPPPQRIDREQFKQFIAQQRRQPSAEAMGLYIDPEGFGPYIAMVRRIAKKEQREIHELQDEFNKGIADRVFELSKEKFSAENRQKALADLLQRTNDERASELARNDPSASSVTSVRRTPVKTTTNTLASLSLEILNRVTTVDVYLDNTLRRKAADERYKARLAAAGIADTDQKIRTQLTPFLLATQKSRHHARVKVVTWVLCGVLAKIHTLLQLDDRIPESTPMASSQQDKKKEEEEAKEEDDEDEGEECDCCCVGEDTCRCRCQCECHQDDSDSEEQKKPTEPTIQIESVEEETTTAAPASSSPLKRKRSRSRSESEVVMEAVPTEEIQLALETFVTEQLRSTDEIVEDTTTHTMKLLAKAEAHLQETFAGRSFSLLGEVAKQLDTVEGGADGGALSQIVQRLRQGHIQQYASVTKDELRDFVIDCMSALSNECTSTHQTPHQLLFQRACVQFGLDPTDSSTRRLVDRIIAEMTKKGTSPLRHDEALSLHYASVLTLPASAAAMTTTQELTLLEDEGARDQVLVTKRAEARKALAQCPFLIDVHEWTQWHVRFAPFCGPLRFFLRSHELIRLSGGDDHAAIGSFTGDFVVGSTNDRVMKIRSRGDVSASALDAAHEIAPETLALEVVSLYIQQRHDFPHELVLLHLRAILKRSYERENGKRGVQDSTAAFVLETMLAVPLDFAAFVWELLEEAAQAPGLEMQVAAHCTSRGEQRQLQLLGKLLDKPHWKQLREAPEPSASQERPMTTSQLATDRGVVELTTAVQLAPREPSPSKPAPTLVAPLDDSACEAFIRKLRREQFGIGLEIADAATRAVLQTQHRRLERALKRLSDELYSEKTHFVLELLQNADDNTYAVGMRPRGTLELTHEGEIVFTNNEVGFSERNIQAICDVGASTKEADTRSIGKKGIGFKSVFKVSDTPEVHSNGFHIQFHAKQDASGLGYILPYWIESQDRWRDAAGTTFVLPLNAHSLDRQREISESLLAFEPSVLLFLQKIQELQITNHITGGRLAFEKHERGIHATATDPSMISVVTLQSEHATKEDTASHTTQKWFVVRQQLETPSGFSEARGSHTEIAIAIPETMDHDDSCDNETQRPPLQQVFCYLPLRSYGFRFILQGDFEVPSSREAISNGSDWNQWLISQFPLLIPSLVGLVTTQQLPLHSLLRVLPLDSDIQPPFRSIVSDMSRAMRQSPCFPIAGVLGDLAMASELLDVSEFQDDDLTINFLTSQAPMVSNALHKRVLDVATACAMPAMLKAQLRIERLRASHVLRLLTHWAGAASNNEPVVVLHLLRVLGKLLRHDRHKTLLLQELGRIKCFPVRTGHDETWLSLADVQSSVLFLRSTGTKTSRLFVDELCVLADDFTSLLETAFPETRRFLIEQLGMKELGDHDVAIHHIIPAIAKTPSDPSDAEKCQWRERVAFLASHVVACGVASCILRPLIRQAMRVVTWSGRVVSCQDQHQSVCVLLPSDAKKLDACTRWLSQRMAAAGSAMAFEVAALDLLVGKASETEDDALRALWVDCCHVQQLFSPMSENASLVLSTIVEWIHNESNLDIKRQVSAELAQFMDASWSSDITMEEDSGTWWQSSAWLEGSDGQFYRPQELWLASSAVVSLFSRAMVPMSKMSFHSESLRVAWQLKSSPSVDDVIHVLKELSATQEETDVVSTIDASQMTRLYTYLLEQSRRDDVPTSAATIRRAFTTYPLIFLPVKDDDVAPRPARLVGVHQVVWSSGGDLALSVATPLDPVYPTTLRAFFTGVCGVERKPTIEQLQQELQSQLAGESIMAVATWKAHTLPVLRLLTKAVAKGKLSSAQQKALKKALKRLAWIPIASEAKHTLRLCSMKRAMEQLIAFPEDEAEQEIVRLCTALTVSDAADHVADFVDLEEAEALLPLLRLVGAVSVRESLLHRPAEWCRWLAMLGAAAIDDAREPRCRRRRKKYAKMLKRILLVWAMAWCDRQDDFPAAFTTELSTQSLFPSHRSSCEELHRGVDLFLNDQQELTPDQLQHPSLLVQSLYAWNQFIAPDSESDDAALQKLLLQAACMRSLAQHLETEVVVLGAPQPFADESFTLSFHHALELAQRVVFHHQHSTYVRLNHAEMQLLLSTLQIQHVTGDVELVHRVAATVFTLRRSVACYLDKPARRVVVASSGADSPTLLFDVLHEVCRQCFGAAIATSIANVLYLASMQPTAEARDAWLVTTQSVPPLDAQAGTTLWVASDATVSDTTSHTSKRSRDTREEVDIEDGEISEDSEAVDTKRAKVSSSAWQHDQHQETSSWAIPDPHHTAATSSVYPHHHHGIPGPGAFSWHPLSSYTPSASHPTDLGPLAFNASGVTTNGLSDAEKHAIGRWGEEYVYLQLTQSYVDREDVTVEWVNAESESGLPYDIVVTTGKSKDVEYIEVKSTKTMEKGVFEISMNELDQAATHGSKYVIYRVFNAGNAQLCRVVRMKNPVALVRQKKIQLALLMQ